MRHIQPPVDSYGSLMVSDKSQMEATHRKASVLWEDWDSAAVAACESPGMKERNCGYKIVTNVVLYHYLTDSYSQNEKENEDFQT